VADKPPIEIWPKLHALAEQNVAQARTTYGQFMDFIAQTLAASNVMPIPLFSGFSTIQRAQSNMRVRTRSVSSP